jgi:predicted MFS family arabinose efflux permease
MLGPAIAAVLSRWTDYIGIQFVLGFIVLLVGTITVIVIPDDMDHDEDNEKESTINVPYVDIIKNKRVSMAFVMYFMNAIGYTFYEPILSIRLRSLGLAEENVAFGFIVLAAFEAIGSVIIGYISEKIDKRIVIFGSFLFFSLSIYLTGGGAEESLVISFIGLSMVGFF